MKKFLNTVVFILIILVFLVTIIFLPRYDAFISEKIITKKADEETDPPVLFADNNFSSGQKSLPVFSIANETLQIMYKNKFIVILPEGYSVNPDSPAAIFEVLLSDGNFKFSEDGSKAVFMLTFNRVNVLFYCDLEAGTVVKIDDKVDSYAISPDGSYVVYATGYVYSNSLFVYKNGVSTFVAENVSALYESEFDQIALKTSDNYCSVYSVFGEKQQIITDGVESLCLPTEKGNFNYTSLNDTFTVFFRKNNHIYGFEADKSTEDLISSGKLTCYTGKFESIVPYRIFKTDSAIYKFFKGSGVFSVETADEEDKTLLNDVVCIYAFDGASSFIVGTKKAIILYDSAEDKSTELISFTGRYRNCDDLIENHISVATDDFKTIYVCSLDSTSWIWKKKYPESWLNRFSKYSYSLQIVTLENDSPSLSHQSFPSSVSLYEAIKMNDYLYLPVNDGEKTIVYRFDGSELSTSFEGNIKIMSNETGVYCAKFEDQNVTIYQIS